MRKIFTLSIFTMAVFWFLAGCNGGDHTPPPPEVQQSPVLNCVVQRSFPHDTSSFTEGFLVYKGKMYESGGDPDYAGKSKLTRIDLSTGKIEKQITLDKKYFGEGIVILHDTIYQLTYKEKVIFVYDMNFEKINELMISTDNEQGWGMTTDGTNLIVDDGSNNLYYYEPKTFKLLKKLSVTDAGSLGYNLNELEYIDGFVYANQWQLPYILKIDPANGQVVAKVDLTDLWNTIRRKDAHAEVLNGIAYDEDTRKIYVTGKYWPEFYEVQFTK